MAILKQSGMKGKVKWRHAHVYHECRSLFPPKEKNVVFHTQFTLGFNGWGVLEGRTQRIAANLPIKRDNRERGDNFGNPKKICHIVKVEWRHAHINNECRG